MKKPLKGHVSRPQPRPVKPAPPPAAPPAPVVVKEAGMGFLHVFSKPWAEFFIDGRRYGNTPTKIPIVLSEGRHQLLIKRAGFKDYTETVTITKNDTARIRVTLEP